MGWGSRRCRAPAADSSAPRTARNGRLLHGSLTLPGVRAFAKPPFASSKAKGEIKLSNIVSEGVVFRPILKRSSAISHSSGLGEEVDAPPPESFPAQSTISNNNS
ncbi:hypothetical protein KY285_018437 [Solanum tuberosum]|nr:hypothetical protein KY289_029066 [Solanum tuberosum]KAH0663735.1 hypothetical protein KY284_028666 [Solanum tuberosum]KAH0704159.1 hypothetical protein KY285_018437 [Solanum tuberosum]